MKLLEEVVKQKPHYSSQKVILNVCVVWWVENLDGYNHFLLTYPYIIEALEVIAHKLHLEKYLNWSDWDNEFKRRAASALVGISNFEFCVVFTTIIKSLFYLWGPTKKIQGRSLDLCKVVGQVMVICNDLVFAQSDEGKKFFARCFKYASEIAGLINVKPSMPWIAAHQQHRPNVESNTPFDYYYANMCSPFLNQWYLFWQIWQNCSSYGWVSTFSICWEQRISYWYIRYVQWRPAQPTSF